MLCTLKIQYNIRRVKSLRKRDLDKHFFTCVTMFDQCVVLGRVCWCGTRKPKPYGSEFNVYVSGKARRL